MVLLGMIGSLDMHGVLKMTKLEFRYEITYMTRHILISWTIYHNGKAGYSKMLVG
ncbi:hypothetical protein AAZX31_09G248400 [Glycine max]